MNNLMKFSEAQLGAWNDEIIMLQNQLLQRDVPLTKEQFLTEQEVCQLLSISDRTMRRYRNESFLHCMKFKGRVLFLKIVFLQDLLWLNLQSGRNKKAM